MTEWGDALREFAVEEDLDPLNNPTVPFFGDPKGWYRTSFRRRDCFDPPDDNPIAQAILSAEAGDLDDLHAIIRVTRGQQGVTDVLLDPSYLPGDRMRINHLIFQHRNENGIHEVLGLDQS